MKVNNSIIRRLFKIKTHLFIFFLFVIIILLIKRNFKNKGIKYKSHKNKIVNQIISTTNFQVKNDNQLSSSIYTYPNLLKCQNNYDSSILNENDRENYNIEAHKSLHNLRIVRGILLFYPALQYEYFEQEFRWLYRSWVEMQKHEPTLWRTDLIIFLDHNLYLTTKKTTFQEFNCSINNIRKTKMDEPMCTIFDYVGIKSRNITSYNKEELDKINSEDVFRILYKNIDIFNENEEHFWKFYGKLKEITSYNYLDSIIMAFDGYKYFKNNFDFLLRTDMDIFLTPLFAKWLPLNCNDFITGGGAFGHDFNMKRLNKAAKYMNLEFLNIRNLGSTWYSTPAQIRIVSYYTLVSMAYLNSEEFSEPERQSKVGTILWPEWHYGVLLLYGQCIAMNHLIATKQITVKKLDNLIDYSSDNEGSIFSKVHIHVYHGDTIFSKFYFRDGRYDNMTLPRGDFNQIKYYCLNIALESKRKSSLEIHQMFQNVSKLKN